MKLQDDEIASSNYAGNLLTQIQGQRDHYHVLEKGKQKTQVGKSRARTLSNSVLPLHWSRDFHVSAFNIPLLRENRSLHGTTAGKR